MSSKKINVVIVEKSGNLKETSISLTASFNISKTTFIYNFDSFKIAIYGKINGKAGKENKYEFPPPFDNILFFEECVLVKYSLLESIPLTLTISEWKELYNNLYGGFEDLNHLDDDEEEYAEQEEERQMLNNPNIKFTKEGYIKDGMIVDDDEIEECGDTDEEMYVENVKKTKSKNQKSKKEKKIKSENFQEKKEEKINNQKVKSLKPSNLTEPTESTESTESTDTIDQSKLPLTPTQNIVDPIENPQKNTKIKRTKKSTKLTETTESIDQPDQSKLPLTPTQNIVDPVENSQKNTEIKRTKKSKVINVITEELPPTISEKPNKIRTKKSKLEQPKEELLEQLVINNEPNLKNENEILGVNNETLYEKKIKTKKTSAPKPNSPSKKSDTPIKTTNRKKTKPLLSDEITITPIYSTLTCDNELSIEEYDK